MGDSAFSIITSGTDLVLNFLGAGTARTAYWDVNGATRRRWRRDTERDLEYDWRCQLESRGCRHQHGVESDWTQGRRRRLRRHAQQMHPGAYTVTISGA